jgi:hypothetical protein
LISIR